MNTVQWIRSLMNTVKWTGINWTKFYEPEHDKSIKVGKYIYIYSLVKHFNFYLPTWPKYSFASVTPPFLRINWTKIFLRIIKTTISTCIYSNQNIRLHPWHLYFYVSTRPRYSFASVTPPFLRINLTEIFYRILDTSISSYQLDRNLSRSSTSPFLCIYSTRIFSLASSTPPFLRIYSTEAFYCILDKSISLYLLDRNILSHPQHLHFFVSTRPEYSIASSDTSISSYLLDQNILRILETSICSYVLDRNIQSHPLTLHRIYST